jgi:hypothetical protein
MYRGDQWHLSPKSLQNIDPLRQKLHELLQMQAVEQVVNPDSPGFYSRFFVLPKKMSGQWRAILDLKALNQFLIAPKFKMETAESIRRELSQSKWTTSIDLVDAYLHVPIHKSFRHYLRFVVDGVPYQYRALPAGLSTAPGVFTRVIGVIKTFLHRLGIQIHQYLDDWLIRAVSFLICHNHTQVSLHITQMLGFVAHSQKSQLTPVQIFIFLGYLFLLHLGIVRPTFERWTKLVKILTLFVKAKALPARMWQRLLGLLDRKSTRLNSSHRT